MIRVFGAALLIAGCGGFGFSIAASQRREMRMLRQLIAVLQQMEWELKYRMTELPELCQIAANSVSGPLRAVFEALERKLERREVTDISGCLNGIVYEQELPKRVQKNLKQLGSSLGRYDLEGQLQGLEVVRRQCRKDLEELEENSVQRLRSYQILALCTGAALVILFV